MPLYEYECKKCHHRFERMQKFSDPHVKKCPKCKGPIEQVISAPAVQFKGSGWYATDYSKKPHASTSESDHKEKAGEKAQKDEGDAAKLKKPDKSEKAEKAK
jgi:putative FmdB family regulatory protein